mgnify:FL=1
MICQHCGNPLPKGAKFCSICGQPQAQLTCNNCGTPLEPNTLFCSNCGTPVTNTSTAPEAVRTPPTQKTSPVYDWDPFELNELDTLTFVLTKKYAEFQGRASRSEFFRYNLMISLCLTIIPIIMGIIKLVSNNIMTVIVLYVLLGIIELALILPGLAIAVRRLHDTNKSGWFFLINFIPIVGPIWFLILMLTKGDTYTNNYGERTSYIQITPDIQRKYGLRPSPTSTSTVLYIIAYVVLISISIGLSAATIATSFNPINNTTPTHYSTNTTSNNSSVKATPAPQPASTNTQSVAQNNAVEESTKALQNYYRYLTNKDFANAYTYLSDEQRASLGTYDYWRNGYKSTLSTTLLSAKAVSVSPDTVVYNYRIESKDLINGRIKHQTFTGNVTMVKNNNNWIIQDQDGQLADSYYE